MIARAQAHPDRRPDSGFTLTELLVVMGVIAIVAVLTVISVKGISSDARLSSGQNTVIAVLSNARALAMRNNRPVMAAFYPTVSDRNEPHIRAIVAEWAGDSWVATVEYPGSRLADEVFDRFRPVAGVPVRELPRGITVAGPAYADAVAGQSDELWYVPSNLSRRQGAGAFLEEPGPPVGVMFAADGTVHTSNPANDSSFFWLDFVENKAPNGLYQMSRTATGTFIDDWYFVLSPNDEVCVRLVPFLAVVDEDRVREQYVTPGGGEWNDSQQGTPRQRDLSAYLNRNADRIHFNQYTGVALR